MVKHSCLKLFNRTTSNFAEWSASYDLLSLHSSTFPIPLSSGRLWNTVIKLHHPSDVTTTTTFWWWEGEHPEFNNSVPPLTGIQCPLLLNVLLTSKRSGTCMLHPNSTLPRLAGRMASINCYSVIVHAICHKLFYLSIQLGQPPTAFSSHSPNEPGCFVPYWHQTLISLL